MSVSRTRNVYKLKHLCKHSFGVLHKHYSHSSVRSSWWNIEDSNQIPKGFEEMKHEYNEKMTNLNEDESSLILWDGLKRLYCVKHAQKIAHLPSDIVWHHKTKNIYLLELERAIQQSKWREWLHICYGMINLFSDKHENSNIKYGVNRKGGPIPQRPDYVINADSQKSLIPFLIKQSLQDPAMYNDIISNLTPQQSGKILEQFKERIERSDILYNIHERNKYVTNKGNQPLRRMLRYDQLFDQTIKAKMAKLEQIDSKLAQLFKQSWFEKDIALKAWITQPNDDTNRSYDHDNGNEMEIWDKKLSKFVSIADLENDNVNSSDLILKHDISNPRDKIIYEKLEKYSEIVPPAYRGHHDLLKHTMEDCPKLVMLDENTLTEGYTGDNSSDKWGLWRANNLPIVTLRKHLLVLRDLITNYKTLGKYIEIDGKYGTGKSLALMYAVNVARKAGFLCIHCPDSHVWVERVKLTVPANDRDSLFYQHEYAREFFENVRKSEKSKLEQIELSNKYQYQVIDNDDDSNQESPKDANKIDLDTVYAMLEDPVDIKRYEAQIMREWLNMGQSHSDNFAVKSEWNTLLDLVEHACDTKLCKYPASLMYDFMDEIKKQRKYKVFVACDNINYWNNLVFGLGTPRNPKVYAWQLSMVDVFSQLQQENALPNGIVVMAKTTQGMCRTPQFKTKPNITIQCPETYTNEEFDTMMWNYQGIGLSSENVAPDDYKKIYAASARKPLYVQRLASLF